MMFLRIESAERAEEREDGRDARHGDFGKPPPAHILRDLPWEQPGSLN